MKRLKTILSCSFICLLLLASVACRDTSGKKSGTATGQAANGDSSGSESPGDNEGSGSSPGATPSKENNDQ
jgi:hypothetical protein